MRMKKAAALAAALLLALTAFPALTYAADLELEAYTGEYFSTFIWEGFDPWDDVVVESGALPPGIAVYEEYNSSSSSYYFYLRGTPASAGTYDFRLELQPYGAMYSTVDVRITVRKALKIKTKTMPEGTVGVSYSETIETNYPADQVEFVELWNPGVGEVLTYLGLELLPDGTVTGVPKRAGTYYFWVEADSKIGYSSDTAAIKIVINENGASSQPGGDGAPNCVFDQDSIFYYVPGEPFDLLLFTAMDDTTEVGSLEGLLPEGVELEARKDGSVHLTGTIEKDAYAEGGVLNSDGSCEIELPLIVGSTTWFVHYVLRVMPTEKMGDYPAGAPLPVGF